MAPGVLLGIAIISEVIGTSALRQSDGFTRPLPVAIMAGAYVLSFYLLSIIVRDIPIGLAYAIWAGCGTVLIVVVDAVVFGTAVQLATIGGIALVVAGVMIINLTAAH